MLPRTLILAVLVCGPATAADGLVRLLEGFVKTGDVIGGQVLVRQGDQTIEEGHFGKVAPQASRSVDSATQFCIGSVSKPLASSVVLSLADQGILSIDEPVRRWLDGFDARLTLRHLLSHHGGIYSQRDGLSETQMRWIRDFRLTLQQSVDGIAKESSIAAPGERYAYSGAGYCVIGRVAEAASDRTFEELLQKRLAGPLGMRRTTYFPDSDDPNVATGSSSATPHLLGNELQLPLIGGSVYLTAGDLGRFARMIIAKGRLGDAQIISRRFWSEMTTQQSYTDARYALGWGLRAEPMRIRHSGALATSRAVIEIDLVAGRYAIVLYTLNVVDSADVQRRIAQTAATAVNP